MNSGASASRPLSLTSMEIEIEIDRQVGRLVVPDAEIYWTSRANAIAAENAQQLEWVVKSGLLPDELIIIFGKPRAWSGPTSPPPERLETVDSIFPSPFVMGRTQDCIHSGRPSFAFPSGHDCVAWSYGVVLMRGRDTPLTAHPLLKIRRVP